MDSRDHLVPTNSWEATSRGEVGGEDGPGSEDPALLEYHLTNLFCSQACYIKQCLENKTKK